MNPEWLDHYVCQYQMADTTACKQTIERLENSQRWGQSNTSGGADRYSRDSDQIQFLAEFPAVEHEPILVFAQQCLNHYTSERKQAGETPPFGLREGYNILRYKPGEAYHAVHSDAGWPNLIHRHLTLCMYLNTIEEGGETEFPEQSLKVKPVAGKTVIFPASWIYPHRSLPTDKTRFVFNVFYGFLEGGIQ